MRTGLQTLLDLFDARLHVYCNAAANVNRGSGGGVGWPLLVVFHPMILILGVNNFNHDFFITDLFSLWFLGTP